MNAFILQGSKGGAGRTTSSVILATGLAWIGHRPVHLQLGVSGFRPAVALTKCIPFPAGWLPEEKATQETIQTIIEARPDCDTIVIDMPKRSVQKIRFRGVRAAVLIPMRPSPHEIEVAARDYQKLQQPDPRLVDPHDEWSPARPSAAWILPNAWPRAISKRSLALKMAPFSEEVLSSSSSPSILMPGIPEIPRKKLDHLINGSNFFCSDVISDAAILLARAAMKALADHNN